jgi:hypothetical protein
VKSEDREDIENVEAWAEVFKAVLYLVPMDRRAAVLALATKNEKAERKEWEAIETSGGGLKFIDLEARPPSLAHDYEAYESCGAGVCPADQEQSQPKRRGANPVCFASLWKWIGGATRLS